MKMSVQNQQAVWSVKETIDSKYEKCRNITEEIYKRINITFQIKQLETAAQSDGSDHSEQIDSNELSNETDLFACDKTSISSSTEAEKPTAKFVNINNNEEKPKKPVVVYKRPRKRFRKRVKKRQSKQRSDSDGSSDEALPLSRMVEGAKELGATERGATEPGANSDSPDRVMGVPNVVILAKDLMKPKIQPADKRSTNSLNRDSKKSQSETENSERTIPTINKTDPAIEKKDSAIEKKDPAIDKIGAGKDGKGIDYKSCNMCSLSFRGERGLRRHITMSHLIEPIKPNDMKPA
ncbi:uncharacterized protein LOC114360431 [Ostrinia furnacalis]|uniref:uncharacterized protein LOC114360431 n=1 Tax=Ostrinia furnacalis TaxID=93504 RepID=UPI00103C01FB|nr:uncharacterized protein LOC114360431 [Ostrinia furnacalis]